MQPLEGAGIHYMKLIEIKWYIKCICMQAQMETKLDHIAAVFLPM